MTNRYVITFQNGNSGLNAGAKAPSDIAHFLECDGYGRFDISTMQNGTSFITYYFQTTWKLLTEISRRSIVVVQYPVYSNKGMLVIRIIRPMLKLFKMVKFIALVHDIRHMREESYSKSKEIAELNSYSAIIVHSTRMRDLLIKSGCNVKFSILGLFDYYVREQNRINRNLSKEICFAGNLRSFKFIEELPTICHSGLIFNLYGSSTDCSTDNVRYCGSFKPDDVSSIQGSWGLVWEGDSIDSLHGTDGEYQKYISPHKASLYIVAGLPMIVSSKSAIADYVQKNGIGICINSLNNLDSIIDGINEETYQNMLNNIQQLSEILKNGLNIKRAIHDLCQ